MKIRKTRFIAFIFFLFLFSNIQAQVVKDYANMTTQERYEFHIDKKKANNTAAWITFGGGIAMFIGGIGINVGDGILSGNENKGLWLSYLGGASVLTSIPLFIASGKHKRRAKIQLQNGAVGFNNKISYYGMSVTFSF